jgi:sterol desaturase/sphingolipid hydroxylase (fatty acid hydroxylase superfamily)
MENILDINKFVALDLGKISLGLYLALVVIEIVLVKYFHASGRMEKKDSLVCITLGLISGIANGAAAFLTVALVFWAAQFQIQTIELSVTSFFICFILDDFRYYLHHRIAHRCRWVWAMHVVHHSSQYYNFTTALRQSWFKNFTGTPLLKIPLVLIGFDPVLVLFCGALNPIYQFVLHTEMVKKLPKWYEYIFNTPSHHRVHHANNTRYLDANYAGVLIIWDRMLGTFAEEDMNDLPVYGLVTNINTHNIFTIIFKEYLDIFKDMAGSGRSLLDRLLYLLAPPGWSHDGSRTLTEEKQREYFTKNPDIAKAMGRTHMISATKYNQT